MPLMIYLLCCEAAVASDGVSDFNGVNSHSTWLPLLNLSIGYDNNLSHRSDDLQGSSFALLSAEGQVRFGRLSYAQIEYGVEKGTFFHSELDNYLDAGAKFMGHMAIGYKQRANVSVSLNRQHEARGTGLSQGNGDLITEPTQYELVELNGNYELGALTSRFHSKLGLSHLEKTFLNQRQLTQFRDYELNSAQLNIGYRVLPKTSWVLDLGLSETNYQYQHVGLLSLNNRVSSVLTGVIWEVTGKTTGRAKFGLEKRDFSDNQRKGDTSVAWDIGADWHLRSYSRLSISTGAKTQEPEAQGDYMETKDVALSWQHQWRQRLKTTLSFNMENEMYHGVEREQRIYNSAFIMGYDFNRWLHVDNELRHTQQDSTEMNYQYDKNLILLTLTATL